MNLSELFKLSKNKRLDKRSIIEFNKRVENREKTFENNNKITDKFLSRSYDI